MGTKRFRPNIRIPSPNNLSTNCEVAKRSHACRFLNILPVVAGAAALAAGAFLVVADLIVPITVRLVAGAGFPAVDLDAVVDFLMTVPVLASLDSLA